MWEAAEEVDTPLKAVAAGFGMTVNLQPLVKVAEAHPRTRIWLKLRTTRPPEVGRPKFISGRKREKSTT